MMNFNLFSCASTDISVVGDFFITSTTGKVFFISLCTHVIICVEYSIKMELWVKKTCTFQKINMPTNYFLKSLWGFPGDPVVRNVPHNAGDTSPIPRP